MENRTSVKLPSNIVSTFMDSGSANLALISMTLGPSDVSMNCPYITPLNVLFDFRIANIMLFNISSALSLLLPFMNGSR